MNKKLLALVTVNMLAVSLISVLILDVPMVKADVATFYSDSSDGNLEKTTADEGGDYWFIWNASDAQIVRDSSDHATVGQANDSIRAIIMRGFLFFDTSSIPDDANITSVNLKLYGMEYSWAHISDDFDIVIQSGIPTYPHKPLQASDYNRSLYSGDGGSMNTTGWDNTSWNTITLNSDGRGWINKTGWTKLCLRSSRDIVGIPVPSEMYDNEIVFATCEKGLSYKPKLEVTYSVPTPPTVQLDSPSNNTWVSWYNDEMGKVELKCQFNDPDGDQMDANWYNRTSGGWSLIGTTSDMSNGTYGKFWTGLLNDTECRWSVNVTDGSLWNNMSGWWCFNTPLELQWGEWSDTWEFTIQSAPSECDWFYNFETDIDGQPPDWDDVTTFGSLGIVVRESGGNKFLNTSIEYSVADGWAYENYSDTYKSNLSCEFGLSIFEEHDGTPGYGTGAIIIFADYAGFYLFDHTIYWYNATAEHNYHGWDDFPVSSYSNWEEFTLRARLYPDGSVKIYKNGGLINDSVTTIYNGITYALGYQFFMSSYGDGAIKQYVHLDNICINWSGHPPCNPSNPDPLCWETLPENTTSVNLSCYVSDLDGDSMDVEFYHIESGTGGWADYSIVGLIGTDESVSSGSRANVTWNKEFESGTTYGWLVIAKDNDGQSVSYWTFNIFGYTMILFDPYPRDFQTNVSLGPTLSIEVYSYAECSITVFFYQYYSGNSGLIGIDAIESGAYEVNPAMITFYNVTMPNQYYYWYVIADNGENQVRYPEDNSVYLVFKTGLYTPPFIIFHVVDYDDANQSIINAAITCTETNNTVYTDSDGTVTMSFPYSGVTYYFHVRHPDYNNWDENIEIPFGSRDYTVKMHSKPVTEEGKIPNIRDSAERFFSWAFGGGSIALAFGSIIIIIIVMVLINMKADLPVVIQVFIATGLAGVFTAFGWLPWWLMMIPALIAAALLAASMLKIIKPEGGEG